MVNQKLSPPLVIQALQHSPYARSIAYLALMAGILEVSNRITNPDNQAVYMNIHPPAFPFVLAITYGFAHLRREDAVSWHTPPSWVNAAHFGQGFFVGSAALTSVVGLAMTQGWVSTPAWGWETTKLGDIAQSVALLTALDLLRVWDEEMVFRGYGLDSLQAAFGRSGAVIISAVLFAVAHGVYPVQFLSMLFFAAIATMQRIKSGGLWMPIGFHLAWNLCQCAIFGPTTGPLSIRPLQLHGPATWIGIAGTPEQGWLVAIVLGLLAAWYGNRARQSRNAS